MIKFSESWSVFKMEGQAEREEELAEVLRGVAGGVAVRYVLYCYDYHDYYHYYADYDQVMRGVAGLVAVS